MRFPNILPRSRAFRLASTGLAFSIVAVANSGWTVVKLQYPNTTHSYVYGAHGQQQVGVARPGASDHAAVWSGSAGSWVDLHPPSALFRSVAKATNGISQGGFAQVDVNSSAYDHASLWHGTAASWIDLNPAGSFESSVNGMDTSQQVGFAKFGPFPHAGVWTGSAASWVDLHPLAATESIAYGVHAGQQVGAAMVNSVWRASLWTDSADTWVDLSPNGIRSYAVAVHNGQQVGYVQDGKAYAALWTGTAASLVNLNPAGYHSSRAYAVHDGEQVGSASFLVNGSPTVSAALWRGTPESFINLSAWLPSDLEGAIAYSIAHSGSTTYIGGSAKPTGVNRDLAVIWVSNESAVTSSITVTQGIDVSGGLPEVTHSDDLFHVSKPLYNVPRNTAPLQLEVVGLSPTAAVSILKFRLEGGSDLVGGSQAVSLYNYTTNSYDLLDTRPVSGVSNKVDVVVTDDAERYINPVSRQMKARIAVTPPLNAARSWAYQIDEATWAVTQP